MSNINSQIAANRYGLGARPGEIKDIGKHARDWLLAQISGSKDDLLAVDLPDSQQAFGKYVLLRKQRHRFKQMAASGKFPKDKPKIGKVIRRIYSREVLAHARFAINTPHSFRERLVYFWSNHFAVSARSNQTMVLVGAYEREAIRPRITGRFEDLFIAALKHPAMLFYLDNVHSAGPNSPLGRRRKRGLNENLARESLELHTLGVKGGYIQKDVQELAKALTGWSVGTKRNRAKTPGKFTFISTMHEPGARQFLGKTYKEDCMGQAEDMLKAMARHPSTARHIAFKLARHFVADQPPQRLLKALENNFRKTGGDLQELYKTLISHRDAWPVQTDKFKTPNEFFVSSFRLLAEVPDAGFLKKSLALLGQIPFKPPSPEGWPDVAGEWIGANALQKRIEWANEVAARHRNLEPLQFYDTAFASAGLEATRIAIARAADRQQGLVLALMSPEFQRR